MSCYALFQLGIHPVASRKFSTESQAEEQRKQQRIAARRMPGAASFALTRAAQRDRLHPGYLRSARRPLPGRPHPPIHPSLAFIHDRSLRYAI